LITLVSNSDASDANVIQMETIWIDLKLMQYYIWVTLFGYVIIIVCIYLLCKL
jgi:hypothetical protein